MATKMHFIGSYVDDDDMDLLRIQMACGTKTSPRNGVRFKDRSRHGDITCERCQNALRYHKQLRSPYFCCICGTFGDIGEDVLRYRAQNDTNGLITLCNECYQVLKDNNRVVERD